MNLPVADPQSFEKRSPRFIAILIVAALIGSVFQINFLIFFHRNWFALGRVPIDIAGLFGTEHSTAAAMQSVSGPERIHFIQQQVRNDQEPLGTRRFDCKSFSPTEDRQARVDATIELPRNSRPWLVPDGDSLWIVCQHEVRKIGGTAREERLEVESPRDAQANSDDWSLADGHLEYVKSGLFGVARVSLVDGKWIMTGVNKLPVPQLVPTWNVGGIIVDTLAGSFKSDMLQAVRDGSNIHLFALFDTTLLYRANVELESPPKRSTRRNNAPIQIDWSASALFPENVPFNAEGWSVLTTSLATPVVVVPQLVGPPVVKPQRWYPFLVEGTPAVIVIDESTAPRPTGRAFRRDGDHWSEFGQCSFEFGTEQYSLVTGADSVNTHFLTATSLGGWSCYKIDATGFHRERASGPFDGLRPALERELRFLREIVRNALIATLILGTVASLLMRFATNPNYESGHSRVRLASLWRRGFARAVDLGLIGLSLVPLGMVSLLWIDWPAWLEALNLRLDHPSIGHVWWLILACAAWLLTMMALLGVVQGRYGITPGKWLCGLRVLGTTLKPCGFARSAVREIVFFVDSIYLFCWTPGIVSIALTNRRQRLGDLVADSLVVEARSLKAHPAAQPVSSEIGRCPSSLHSQ